MAIVDVRWRPSGGRGEYEFVPAAVLLEKAIAVEPVFSNTIIQTDVSGQLRDGKPRLRRAHPNDRGHLNLIPLIAALALLPDPRREDTGKVQLPLQPKGYVAAQVRFDAAISGNTALLRPMEMSVLHYEYVIELEERLQRIGELLSQMPTDLSGDFLTVVNRADASADLRPSADAILEWLSHHPEFSAELEYSDVVSSEPPPNIDVSRIVAPDLDVDETRRKLVTHFRIDRNGKIRKAAIDHALQVHGTLKCENCSFDFEQKYGSWGKGYIEVHHLKQLALLLPNEKTSLADLMLICSNCHRMVHRKKTPLTRDQLTTYTH